jgi:hypothetical protein
VSQQWPRFNVETMCSNNDFGSCSLTSSSEKCDRQTDMNEPIKCSSLTLKREEHLKVWTFMTQSGSNMLINNHCHSRMAFSSHLISRFKDLCKQVESHI